MRLSTRSLPNKMLLCRIVGLAISLVIVVCGIIGFTQLYTKVDSKLTLAQHYTKVLQYLLGNEGASRTLILFTNNAEMRYGGGFIGSVGYVVTQKGKSAAIDPIHSVYYYDHRINGNDNRLADAPLELQGLTAKIWLRDSGINLEWTQNAQQAARLFELESGKKVDNVVMLTPNLVREMLKITGPVYLSDYGFAVTYDNFLTKVQLEVEAGDDKQAGKDPKTILGVLANQLLEKLFTDTSLRAVANQRLIIEQMAKTKQLALYSRNRQVQASITRLGLSGALKPAEDNYLMVAEANVGANKSSPFMKQIVEQNLQIHANGDATAEVRITRHHTGQYTHQYIDPHDGLSKWLVGANLSYMKLAVPAGSQLQSGSTSLAKDPYVESGRTVFTFLSHLEPGNREQYIIRYKLPFRYRMDDNIVINTIYDKPIGSFNQEFRPEIHVPSVYIRTTQLPGSMILDQSKGYTTVFMQSKSK